MKSDTTNEDIRYCILATMFIIFSFNVLVFFSYKKNIVVSDFLKLYLIIISLFFLIVSFLGMIFPKYFIKFNYLYTGSVHSITSLQFLFMSFDVFLTTIRFSKAITIISILLIIYLIIIFLFLKAIKRKLERRYVQSTTRIKPKFIALFSALGILLSKITINISEYVILGFCIYCFACVCSFGFYQLYMHWYYNNKKKA